MCSIVIYTHCSVCGAIFCYSLVHPQKNNNNFELCLVKAVNCYGNLLPTEIVVILKKSRLNGVLKICLPNFRTDMSWLVFTIMLKLCPFLFILVPRHSRQCNSLAWNPINCSLVGLAKLFILLLLSLLLFHSLQYERTCTSESGSSAVGHFS